MKYRYFEHVKNSRTFCKKITDWICKKITEKFTPAFLQRIHRRLLQKNHGTFLQRNHGPPPALTRHPARELPASRPSAPCLPKRLQACMDAKATIAWLTLPASPISNPKHMSEEKFKQSLHRTVKRSCQPASDRAMRAIAICSPRSKYENCVVFGTARDCNKRP